MLALGAVLQTYPCVSAQDGKLVDVLIQPTPPGSVEAGNGSKKARSKPVVPSAKPRVAAPTEVKAYSFATRGPGSERAARALVVRSGENDPKSTTQLQEDLAVMTRILEKAVAEYKEDHEEAAGIPIVVLGGGRSVRAMYLEDYGAVFTLTVNIPLRTEPKIEESDESRGKAANEEWNEARNELFGERGANRAERTARRDFDPQQLEEFRGALIDSLRNAANIRNLKPSDWVTLVVRSRGGEEEIERRFDVFLGNGPGHPPVMSMQSSDELSTMVLRVKKSDLDEYGRKPGNSAEFKKKVSVSLY